MSQTSPDTLTVLCQTITVKREHLSRISNVVSDLVKLGVEMNEENELGSLAGSRSRHAVLLELCSFGCVIEFKNHVTRLKVLSCIQTSLLLSFVDPIV